MMYHHCASVPHRSWIPNTLVLRPKSPVFHMVHNNNEHWWRIWSNIFGIPFIALVQVQGVSKKRYFLDFLSYFSSRGRILLFHMCFGIRILSPFHLAIQKVSIQNLNCPKNAKNACADMIFIPAQSSLRKAGIKIMSAHAFLGQLRFWMDTFWIARWNGLEILIPKHMWKSKIRPLELK